MHTKPKRSGLKMHQMANIKLHNAGWPQNSFSHRRILLGEPMIVSATSTVLYMTITITH